MRSDDGEPTVTSGRESIRTFLIAEVQRFVASARQIPGVRRIAVIGSLTTMKENPKDADLLVWIDDDADLAPLAAAGRRLQGRAQGRNKGADIFLASPDNTYLGRICHYRDCRAGIRMSCRAMHCGRRAHLCDDLDRLKLSDKLLKAPPLDLWPFIVRRCPLPDDIEGLAIAMRPVASSAADQPQLGQ